MKRYSFLGRYNGDIDKFIFDTELVKNQKGRYKQNNKWLWKYKECGISVQFIKQKVLKQIM